MNGMVISAAPMKSVGAVTVETKPGMTEKEKSDIEEELERIKLRLQKTERELDKEKKLTRSQVCQHDNNLSYMHVHGVMVSCPEYLLSSKWQATDHVHVSPYMASRKTSSF